MDQAITIASEVAELQRCLIGGRLDAKRLGRTLQDSLDCAVTVELKDLEKSSVLELRSA